MDSALTSGVNVTVVGITVVFTALTLLMLVVSIMGNSLSGPAPADPAEGDDDDTGSSAAAAQADVDVVLRNVAVAAYALHKSRRVSVRGPQPASSWLSAGRQRQVGDRSQRR